MKTGTALIANGFEGMFLLSPFKLKIIRHKLIVVTFDVLTDLNGKKFDFVPFCLQSRSLFI
jgi:hypothetical protein